MKGKLIEVKNLAVDFDNGHQRTTVFQNMSFDIYRGEVTCLVGESGSGKSVIAKSILQLLPVHPSYGEILFDGQDLLQLREKQMQKIRGKEIAIIFQDALSALNPVYTIGTQMIDVIRLHTEHRMSKHEAKTLAIGLLRQVEIARAEEVMKQYPFQLSGGMRQRVMIAMALSTRPKLLLADEPTTALDVTVQAQILKLLRKIKDQYNMTVLFITHDLGVVHEMADRVIVIRQGELIEQGSKEQIFTAPKQAYTKQLLNSMPRIPFKEGSS